MMPERLGRYRVVEEIGRGECSIVYRARDEQNGRELALKLVKLDLGERETQAFMARLRRRAEAAASVGHPLVVRYHSGGREGRYAYLAMELVVGRSLRRLLEGRRPLPLSTVLDFAVQLTDVLACAHAKDLALGSLRPGNVLIDADGKLRLTSFTSLSSQRDASVAAIHYLAPEQILVQPSDARADIFALGVLMYEMVTAWPPFGGEAELELRDLRQKIVSTEAPPPGKRNPALPAKLEEVILRALARDPSRRYQSAALLGEALLACRAPAPRQAPGSVAATSPGLVAADFESSLVADIERFSQHSDMILRRHVSNESAKPELSATRKPAPLKGREPPASPLPAQLASAPAASSPAGPPPTDAPLGNPLLQRLAAQAQRLQEEATRKRQGSASQFDAGANLLEAKMRQAFKYLSELTSHLEVLRPSVQRSYPLLGLLEFKDLVWSSGFADFRLLPGIESNQLIDYVSLSYVLSGPSSLRVEREGPAIEQLRRHLFDFGIAFECEEMSNERRHVERGIFTIANEVKVSLVFKARHREADLLISCKNLERLGSCDYRIAASAMTQTMLDEMGKLLLGEPNHFLDYAERQNPLG